jgi:hypothetical protein
MRHYLISIVSAKDQYGYDIVLLPTIIYAKTNNPATPNMIWLMWGMWGIEIKINKQ